MRKQLLILANCIFFAGIANAQTNLLQNGDMETQGVWQYNNWQKGSTNLDPSDVDFGYSKTLPKYGSGKCFHTDGTSDGNWDQVKVALWQPILLKKGHVYKVTGAFKDNSDTPFSNSNNDGIWAEIHFYYKAPVIDSIPNQPAMYAFNSWNNPNVDGMDGTFQDNAATYALGADSAIKSIINPTLDSIPSHPYYAVPDSIFKSGKDTITLYFCIQYGGTAGNAGDSQTFDFTMDEFSVIDSLDLIAGVKTGELSQHNLSNYPNPFNLKTTIAYAVLYKSNVELSVYNLAGEKVSSIINEEKSNGNYTVSFDGSGLSGGVYFYTLKENGRIIGTQKMIILK